jgi:hypothetical protein
VGDVAEVDEAALRAGLAVVVQVLAVHGAAAARRQVAELAVEAQPARGEVARRERGVVVRRDVPVPGHGDLRAGLAAAADGREEQPGLALVPDREGDPGRVEDGHAEEVEAHVASGADAALLVDRDPAGAQRPVVVAGRARGVAHDLEVEDAAVAQLHAARGPAHLALEQLELGALEAASLALEAAASPAHPQRRIEVLDDALEAHAALLGVDLGGVRGEQALARPDAHVAGEACIPRAAELALVAGHVDARVLRIRRAQFLEARVVRGARAAQRIVGACGGCHEQARNRRREQPSQAPRGSSRRLHRSDYNCHAPRHPTFRGSS